MTRLVLLVLWVGCVQPQQSPVYSAQQAQGQPGGAPGYATPQGERRFTFNGRGATPDDLALLVQIEHAYGRPAPSGDYWYDAASGAAGQWGGPTLGFLPAGLTLGGPLPANASGGGNGHLTGIVVNGRELHPVDVQVLIKLYGQAIPGRWWVDGQGNAGQEGGPALLNLVQLARQRGNYYSVLEGRSLIKGGPHVPSVGVSSVDFNLVRRGGGSYGSWSLQL
jgi:hypothetical protein